MIGLICGLPVSVLGVILKVCCVLNTGHNCFMACMMMNTTIKPPKVGLVKTVNLRGVVTKESLITNKTVAELKFGTNRFRQELAEGINLGGFTM